MRRWVVGFELHHKLLLSVHQPALSAGYGRMTINEWAVFVGHAAESGEHPDRTGSDLPSANGVSTRIKLRGLSMTV